MKNPANSTSINASYLSAKTYSLYVLSYKTNSIKKHFVNYYYPAVILFAYILENITKYMTLGRAVNIFI